MERESGRPGLRERTREGERGIVTCCGFYKHTHKTQDKEDCCNHTTLAKKAFTASSIDVFGEREREGGMRWLLQWRL